jgi:hypothetical protein
MKKIIFVVLFVCSFGISLAQDITIIPETKQDV